MIEIKEKPSKKQVTSVFRLPILLAAVAFLSLTACEKVNTFSSKPFAMHQAKLKTEINFTIAKEDTYDYQLNFAKPEECFPQFINVLDDKVDAKGLKHDVPIDISLEVFKIEAGKEQLQTKHTPQALPLISHDSVTYDKQIYSQKLLPGNYRATLVLNQVTPQLADYKASFSVAETYLGK
jgi:hypothetical protein